MVSQTTLMVITPTLECGGAEKYTALLCNNISKEKFRVVLVVINNVAPFFKIDPRIELIDLGKERVAFGFLALKKVINSIKPAIILSTAGHVALFNAMFRGFYGHQCNWIARETSIASINTRHSNFAPIYRRLLKIFYSRNDLVICPNEAMVNDLINNFGFPAEKCKIIPSGVDVQPVSNPVEVDLLSAGRLSREKGFDRVLHALSGLQRPYHYIIAGDGNLKEQLEAQANRIIRNDRKIEFPGMIDNPVAKYAKAKVFISGSYYEGSPNAVLEANTLGIPVVAFNVPGVREVIKHGWNGFLVKDGDTDEFAKKIEEALEYPFKREEIAEHTREQFGLKKMIKSTEAAILQLLNRNDD